jgi:hypothetical protein
MFDRRPSLEAEAFERRERLVRWSRSGGQARVELGEAIGRAGEQERVDGGEEEIRDRLAGGCRRDDGQEVEIGGRRERERLVEW